MQFDVIIIGGSFAGLAAALQLGRARRTVLVIDAGERRNRFASAAHGFLGRDGVAPGQIIAEATSQLARYVTVATLKGSASKAGRTEEGFYVETHNDTFHGKRLILAGGVADVLPDIPGLADRWGWHPEGAGKSIWCEVDRGAPEVAYEPAGRGFVTAP